MMRSAVSLTMLLGLAACAPMALERAEEVCFETARSAAGPRGTVSIGTGTQGPSASVELSVSSDYLTGRDPAEVYDSCVYQKSGQMPSRPLDARPDWKG